MYLSWCSCGNNKARGVCLDFAFWLLLRKLCNVTWKILVLLCMLYRFITIIFMMNL